jgi:hypothetical protein
MRPAKTSLTIAVPLAALALAGCGGGGDDSTSTAATTETTALSKADLISQGDAICGEVNAAIGSIGSSEEEVPEQITQVANLYIGMVGSLKGLGAPDEDAGYPEFLAAAEELSSTQSATKLATEREDTLAIGEATEEAAPALEEFQSVAGEYGFEECSEGPSTPTAGVTGAATGSPEEIEEGGVEAAPEEIEEEVVPEEVAPEEVAPETGGAGGGVEEAAPEGGGGTAGGGSGGVGPG